MKVYILSHIDNLPICDEIAIKVRALGHTCSVFEGIGKFTLDVDSHEDLPDLYVMDFFLYNHYVFNAYRYLRENDCYVPLMFFNDPQKKLVETPYYWKNMIELLYTTERFKWEKYENLICHIVNFSQESLIKHDATIQKDFIDLKKRTPATPLKNETEISPENLSCSELIIYKRLIENLNESISIKDLQLAVKKTSKICRESTIACIVSSLRKKLKASDISSKQIIKNGSGYKMISL